MEIKSFIGKLKDLLIKYKYALVILLIGLIFLLIPDSKPEEVKPEPNTEEVHYNIDSQQLTNILQNVEGAGHVQVLLSVATGDRTIYQTNQDTSKSNDTQSSKIETVIISDSQRNETGLISQTDPPTYKGAIIVCQGADSPSVRLAITQAVSKITGLGTDNICVLKMK